MTLVEMKGKNRAAEKSDRERDTASLAGGETAPVTASGPVNGHRTTPPATVSNEAGHIEIRLGDPEFADDSAAEAPKAKKTDAADHKGAPLKGDSAGEKIGPDAEPSDKDGAEKASTGFLSRVRSFGGTWLGRERRDEEDKPDQDTPAPAAAPAQTKTGPAGPVNLQKTDGKTRAQQPSEAKPAEATPTKPQSAETKAESSKPQAIAKPSVDALSQTQPATIPARTAEPPATPAQETPAQETPAVEKPAVEKPVRQGASPEKSAAPKAAAPVPDSAEKPEPVAGAKADGRNAETAVAPAKEEPKAEEQPTEVPQAYNTRFVRMQDTGPLFCASPEDDERRRKIVLEFMAAEIAKRRTPK
ncbi:MAG: hypothetical protein ACFB6R_06565 [Alphaproteobacteria bacterium]